VPHRPTGWCPGLILAALVMCLAVAMPATADDAAIRYFYDDLNRLVGVVDKDGNVAQYVYDAVGNLLRIDRTDAPPATLAITHVSPSRGRVGRAVQIFGKGFSGTAASNTVKFNGTTATVTEASPNRLLTSVPAGATSGAVTVTVSGSTATWTGPFVVGGTLSVTPATASLGTKGTLQFQASEDATPTTNVTWAVNGVTGGDAVIGTISTNGLYQAPARVGAPMTVKITATHTDDRLSTATATVSIQPGTAAVAAAVSIVFAETKQAVEEAAVSVTFGESLVTTRAALDLATSFEPAVTTVAPASAARGASGVALTLTGSGFTGATAVTFLVRNGASFAGDAAVTVSGISVSPNGTQLTATMNVASGAVLGDHVVQVTIAGGTSTSLGTGANRLAVTQ
jgi:YD repeat-containing protein